jgi:hypothetical protein
MKPGFKYAEFLTPLRRLDIPYTGYRNIKTVFEGTLLKAALIRERVSNDAFCSPARRGIQIGRAYQVSALAARVQQRRTSRLSGISQRDSLTSFGQSSTAMAADPVSFETEGVGFHLKPFQKAKMKPDSLGFHLKPFQKAKMKPDSLGFQKAKMKPQRMVSKLKNETERNAKTAKIEARADAAKTRRSQAPRAGGRAVARHTGCAVSGCRGSRLPAACWWWCGTGRHSALSVPQRLSAASGSKLLEADLGLFDADRRSRASYDRRGCLLSDAGGGGRPGRGAEWVLNGFLVAKGRSRVYKTDLFCTTRGCIFVHRPYSTKGNRVQP